jgi:hypothetical protein
MMLMPPELRQLMECYNRLGSLLPQDDPELLDFRDDPAQFAELGVVLAEMSRVEAQITAFLDKARCERRAAGS